jgi:hypothetical protein
LGSQDIVEHHSSFADALILSVDTCCVRPVLRAFPRLRGHLAVELQFGHVVDNAEQLPLRVDLGVATQRESAQAALLDVPEHRFDQAHAMGVDRTAFGTVDFFAHGAAVRVGKLVRDGAVEERQLAHRGDIGCAQTLTTQRAGFAGGGGAFEHRGLAAWDDGVGAAEFECLVGRTHAGALVAIKGEVLGLEGFCFACRFVHAGVDVARVGFPIWPSAI